MISYGANIIEQTGIIVNRALRLFLFSKTKLYKIFGFLLLKGPFTRAIFSAILGATLAAILVLLKNGIKNGQNSYNF